MRSSPPGQPMDVLRMGTLGTQDWSLVHLLFGVGDESTANPLYTHFKHRDFGLRSFATPCAYRAASDVGAASTDGQHARAVAAATYPEPAGPLSENGRAAPLLGPQSREPPEA